MLPVSTQLHLLSGNVEGLGHHLPPIWKPHLPSCLDEERPTLTRLHQACLGRHGEVGHLELGTVVLRSEVHVHNVSGGGGVFPELEQGGRTG